MTNIKTTKRALVSSVLALFLCFAMLLGSTFAWFTDSVTSGSNVITSGTLDVDLVDADGNSMEGKVINFVKAAGAEDEAILWEPGCTYETEPVYVVNNGNLALKYQIIVNGIEGDAKLLEAIEWTVTVGTTEYALDELNGYLLPNTNTDAIVLSGHMKETAGNEYQDLTAGGISITVFATQYTEESDSFGPNYDAAAPWTGIVPDSLEDTTLVITPDEANLTGTITVNSVEDLVYLPKLAAEWVSLYSNGQGTSVSYYYEKNGGKGGAYYYAWTWTIELGADLDMNNVPMDPIDPSYWGTVDGKGHTISNVVVDCPETGYAALFSSTDAIKNLNVNNVKVLGTEKNDNVGAVVGYCRSSMDNVHVTNATISGNKYVGTVAGKVEGNLTNSSATNATVTATGKTAGGLVGYSLGNTTGNTVENVTVIGLYNIGGLLGQLQNNTGENNTADDNAVKNVTVISITAVVGTDVTEKRTGEVVARNYYATVGDNTVENVSTQEWGGAMPETLEIVPGDSAENRGTITVNTAEDLVYLPKLAAEWASLYSASGNGDNFTDYKNGQGAAYYYAWQWTIELGADIDMYNIPVDPINTTFWGTIDGNGHIISNVVVKSSASNFVGLFSVTSGLVKDLNVNNVKVLGTEKNDNVGAVVGYCRGSMDNVHVTNATISGNNYVGTVAGKVEGGITNSSATNATVTATGKTAGGLVGYTLGDTTGNTVDNVTVTGLYNVGGLLGQAQNKTVESNTVKNTTLISTSEIPADKAGDYVRTSEVVARNYNATVGDNTAENVTLKNK